MSQINIKIIVGSVRDGRSADKVALWVAGEVAKTNDVSVEVLDLKEYNMPFFNESVSPSYKTAPYSNEAVARFTAKIAEGDAYIIVAPEYNHSMPAVLKNAMDWVYQEWNNKPVAFVAYGSVGGARSVEHLRGVAVELQMAPIRNTVHIPGDQYFAALFGQTTFETVFAGMVKPLAALKEQLLWWAHALKQARK